MSTSAALTALLNHWSHESYERDSMLRFYQAEDARSRRLRDTLCHHADVPPIGVRASNHLLGPQNIEFDDGSTGGASTRALFAAAAGHHHHHAEQQNPALVSPGHSVEPSVTPSQMSNDTTTERRSGSAILMRGGSAMSAHLDQAFLLGNSGALDYSTGRYSEGTDRASVSPIGRPSMYFGGSAWDQPQ